MGMVELLENYWPGLLAFALYGLLHSIGAREPCKEFLARRMGRVSVDYYWRVIYCILSYLGLYHVISPIHWKFNPSHNVWLIAYPEWLWQVLLLLHVFSVVLAYWAFLQSDYLEFIGFRQLLQGIRVVMGWPPPEPLKLFGTQRLEVRGIYGWVRHPMLSAGFLFLLTSGPSLNNLMFLLMYGVYMVVGGYFEERRLIRIFGEEYLEYRTRVGAYIPLLRIRNTVARL